jgi:DNA-directed RNA polymerase subunit RPC12/RpoP
MQYQTMQGQKQRYMKAYKCSACSCRLETGIEKPPLRCPICKHGYLLAIGADWESVPVRVVAEPKDVLGRILSDV